MPANFYRELLGLIGLRFVPAPDLPDETPESTLCALRLAAAGVPMSAAAAVGATMPELDAEGRVLLSALVEARLGGTPLAYLTGRQRFLDLEFAVRPGVLIPRRETELLARTALELLDDGADDRSRWCLDVGTGCGNLAVALAVARPGLRIGASDLSTVAVDVARENAVRLAPRSVIDFRVGDLLAPFDEAEHLGRCDLIVCNPPYISSASVPRMRAEIAGHEPAEAFDGGYGGLIVLRRLLLEAPRFLAPGGWLALELGAGQGEAVGQRLRATGQYRESRDYRDAHGMIRVVAGRR